MENSFTYRLTKKDVEVAVKMCAWEAPTIEREFLIFKSVWEKRPKVTDDVLSRMWEGWCERRARGILDRLNKLAQKEEKKIDLEKRMSSVLSKLSSLGIDGIKKANEKIIVSPRDFECKR